MKLKINLQLSALLFAIEYKNKEIVQLLLSNPKINLDDKYILNIYFSII